MTEANARIVIDKLLRESDWILPGDDGVVNVDTEMQNQSGFADYVLKDENDFPICIIEAKKELVSPLVGKEQARGYAKSLNCRFNFHISISDEKPNALAFVIIFLAHVN